jgi:hypothetical protein
MTGFGAQSAQTRASLPGTLTAGGGWFSSPPGWGREAGRP